MKNKTIEDLAEKFGMSVEELLKIDDGNCGAGAPWKHDNPSEYLKQVIENEKEVPND